MKKLKCIDEILSQQIIALDNSEQKLDKLERKIRIIKIQSMQKTIDASIKTAITLFESYGTTSNVKPLQTVVELEQKQSMSEDTISIKKPPAKRGRPAKQVNRILPAKTQEPIIPDKPESINIVTVPNSQGNEASQTITSFDMDHMNNVILGQLTEIDKLKETNLQLMHEMMALIKENAKLSSEKRDMKTTMSKSTTGQLD